MKTLSAPKLEAYAPVDLGPPSAQKQPPKPRRFLRWLVAGAVLIAVVAAIWRQATVLPSVTTASVTVKDLWSSFTAEGIVRGREYPISAPAGGRVISLRVREGDTVRKGDVLFQLGSDQLENSAQEAGAAHLASILALEQAQEENRLVARRYEAMLLAAQARVEQARRQLDQLRAGARSEEIVQAAQRTAKATAAREEAEKAYRRAEALFRAGAIAQAVLERAEAAFKSADADLQQAKAAEELLRSGPSSEQLAVAQAAVSSAQADLKSVESGKGAIAVARKAVQTAQAQASRAAATVRRVRTAIREQSVSAPADGSVTKLLIEPGSVVVPGSTALVIGSRQDLRVEAEISTEDTPKLRPGMAVSITSAAYPGRFFSGKVIGLMAAGELKPDAAIRTRIVRARIEFQQHSALFRPGMEVDVEGRVKLGKAVVVPTDCVRFSGSNPSVYVLIEGRVVERSVAVGSQNADQTEIVSGLQVGDVVVLRGKDEISPGARVRAVPR